MYVPVTTLVFKLGARRPQSSASCTPSNILRLPKINFTNKNLPGYGLPFNLLWFRIKIKVNGLVQTICTQFIIAFYIPDFETQALVLYSLLQLLFLSMLLFMFVCLLCT